jgi:thioredoxin-related protein
MVIPIIFRKEDNMLRFGFTCVNKSRAHLFLLVALAASGAAYAGGPDGKSWHHDWDSALRASQDEGRPMLVFVTNKCCYCCEKMRHETYGNSLVVEDIHRDFVPASIDSKRYPEIVDTLNVRVFPTTLIVGRDATVIDSISGYVGPEQMRSWLKASGTKIARR